MVVLVILIVVVTKIDVESSVPVQPGPYCTSASSSKTLAKGLAGLLSAVLEMQAGHLGSSLN